MQCETTEPHTRPIHPNQHGYLLELLVLSGESLKPFMEKEIPRRDSSALRMDPAIKLKT